MKINNNPQALLYSVLYNKITFLTLKKSLLFAVAALTLSNTALFGAESTIHISDMEKCITVVAERLAERADN